MVTKEQAMSCKQFVLTEYRALDGLRKASEQDIAAGFYIVVKSNWRANGKCQIWKRSPERFKLSIKHGLYAYDYITEENAHLFTAA